MDLDIQFETRTTAKLGSSVHAWRHRQQRAISLLSRAVEPLQLTLVRGMPDDVRERAETWNVALIVAMVPLLPWPDRRLTVCFAEGFRTIGCVEPSSVFRPLGDPETQSSKGVAQLTASSEVWRCGLWTRSFRSPPPHPHDSELVTKLVCQEEVKGYQSEPMDGA